MRWPERNPRRDPGQWCDLLFLVILAENAEWSRHEPRRTDEWLSNSDLCWFLDMRVIRAREVLTAGWTSDDARPVVEWSDTTSRCYRTKPRAWWRPSSFPNLPSQDLLLYMTLLSAEERSPDAAWTPTSEFQQVLEATARATMAVAVEGWEHNAHDHGFVEFRRASPLFRLTPHGRRMTGGVKPFTESASPSSKPAQPVQG